MQGKVALVTGARVRGAATRCGWPGGRGHIAVDVCSQITRSVPDGDRGRPGQTARLVEELDRRVVTQVADVRDRGPLAAAVAAGVAALGHRTWSWPTGIIPLGSGIAPVAFLDAVSVDLVGVINTVETAFRTGRRGIDSSSGPWPR